MKENRVYEIDNQKRAVFHNHVDFCIGTGRMGLALQKEYMEQLQLVQEEIGFRHIRGHGLFSDDMAVYHEYEDASGVKGRNIISLIWTLLWTATGNAACGRFWNWVLCRIKWLPESRRSFTGREM